MPRPVPAPKRLRQPPTPPADLAAIAPHAVSIEQAAQMLGIGRTLMYKLVTRREIPSFKIGRVRRIAVSAIAAYTRAQQEISQIEEAAL